MHMIPGNRFTIQERITSGGVERTISIEPAGNNLDHARQQFTGRVAANPGAYGPGTGFRIVLVGGDR